MRRTLFLLGLAAFGLAFAPLGRADDKNAKGTVVEIDGFKSTVPASWKEEEPSEISRRVGRIKQFRIPKVGEDKQDAEFYVSHFPGGGGGVQANIERWKNQFVPPEGKKIDDVAKVETFKVGETPVTYLDVQGTYKHTPGGPFAGGKTELRPHYRMLAVIFESKNGPYFVRLTGPDKTVSENKKGFDAWLKGLK